MGGCHPGCELEVGGRGWLKMLGAVGSVVLNAAYLSPPNCMGAGCGMAGFPNDVLGPTGCDFVSKYILIKA